MAKAIQMPFGFIIFLIILVVIFSIFLIWNITGFKSFENVVTIVGRDVVNNSSGGKESLFRVT